MRHDRRLKRSDEFTAVRRGGRRIADGLFAVAALRTDLACTRWGLSVSKRVGSAVVRNRVKRRIREAVRPISCQEAWDIVISARPAAGEANLAQIEKSLSRLLTKIEVMNCDREGESSGAPRKLI